MRAGNRDWPRSSARARAPFRRAAAARP
jgi:hypothetical protein